MGSVSVRGGVAAFSAAGLIVFLTGCAATQDTLAQGLAWERWEKCRNISGINLQRIEADGRIWITYSPDHTSAVATWRECDRAARTAQGQRTAVASNPVVAATTTPNTLVFPVHAPLWKSGSEWAYRWESPQGRGTFVWSVDGEDTRDGISVYVVRSGQRRILYRRSDLAFYLDEVEGQVETKFVPPFIEYAWPLEPGKKWEQEVVRERPTERQTQVITYACEVSNQTESVVVPAGTFVTLHVTCRNKATGAMSYQTWYSPTVAQWVKQKTWFSYGIRERELIQYRLR